MATIDRMLISWTLSSTVPQVIRSGLGASQFASYAIAFGGGNLGEIPLAPPWTGDPERNRYWRSTVRSLDADGAWQKQVPLKSPASVTLHTGVKGVTFTVERYLHPGGASVAVTAKCVGEFTPEQATELHRLLSQDSVIGDGGSSYTITGTLHWLMDGWEAELLGSTVGPSVRDDHPTTVTTISGASDPVGRDAATSLLQQLCYPGQPAGAWTRVLDAKKGRGNDSIRVAGANAKAIWSPARASLPRDRRSLECYHSNQVRAALHANQLLTVVRAGADRVRTATQTTQDLVQRAATNIRWLHGKGDLKVYHSEFTRVAIDESGLVPTLNELAEVFSLGDPLPLPS